MSDGEIVRLILVALGSAVAGGFVTWLGHRLTGQRDERSERSNEVAYWRQWVDDLRSVYYQHERSSRIEPATSIPDDPVKYLTGETDRLQRVGEQIEKLDASTRRAPEQLVDHVRLLNQRFRRAAATPKHDQYLMNLATKEFRSAIAEYVRTGREPRLRLMDGESYPDSGYEAPEG